MNTARRLLLSGLVASTLLGGCAALKTISAEVRSYGEWPASRKAGSYAFERLPSQQEQPSRSAEWEAMAAPALEKAGFKRAAAAAQADVIVSLGARVNITEYGPWDDPLWVRWNAPLHHWRFGLPPRSHPFFIERRYEREVGVLLRDRVSGQPLFEARASSDGATRGDDSLMQGLFQAALSDFPTPNSKPHEVRVTLP